MEFYEIVNLLNRVISCSDRIMILTSFRIQSNIQGKEV